MKKILFITILMIQFSAFAETEVIQFPDEELATESVLPKFDRPVAVKNRYIETEKKLEIGGFWGLSLNEPFFNTNKLGLNVGYHFSENSAVSFNFSSYTAGVSSYATQLKDEYNMEFERAPAPKSLSLIHYELKMFYGKMSITKKLISHLSLYGLGGVGLATFENKSYPALSLGIGQKFYFNQKFAARLDLKMVANNAPTPTTADNKGLLSTRPEPEADDFAERMVFNTNLDVGVIYMF